jgi:hypothetical protein
MEACSMQKTFGFALVLIGLSVGLFAGVFIMLQTTQNPQPEAEGTVTIVDIGGKFVDDGVSELEIALMHDFTDRTLKGNVRVTQEGRQWTGEVDWHYSGYGQCKIYCDSLQKDKDIRVQYIDDYQGAKYLDRVVEWNDLCSSLTFTFMATEQLDVQGATFGGTSGDALNTITLSVQNTGTADLTVDKYKLGVGGTQHDIPDVVVPQGATASVTLTTGADGQPWSSGTTYDIYVITSTGKQFPYRATAP